MVDTRKMIELRSKIEETDRRNKDDINHLRLDVKELNTRSDKQFKDLNAKLNEIEIQNKEVQEKMDMILANMAFNKQAEVNSRFEREKKDKGKKIVQEEEINEDPPNGDEEIDEDHKWQEKEDENPATNQLEKPEEHEDGEGDYIIHANNSECEYKDEVIYHEGYDEHAWDGIQEANTKLDEINEKLDHIFESCDKCTNEKMDKNDHIDIDVIEEKLKGDVKVVLTQEMTIATLNHMSCLAQEASRGTCSIIEATYAIKKTNDDDFEMNVYTAELQGR
eukprot:Gb_35160 [translate_table: standard]